MKAWEDIINAAMLGTDKPMPGNADMPEAVAEIALMIDAAETLDKEAKFLQKAAVIYNYRQCGFKPLHKPDLPANIAGPETITYCSEAAARVLNDILEEDNVPLLELWMTRCSEQGQLFLPDVLPAVLDKAGREASLRLLVTACSGNRGAWLSRLNPAWAYFTQLTDEEIWQTGKPEERVKLLRKIRADDPDRGRQMLEQTWEQETAAAKVELLKAFRTNAAVADLPWLENILAEKGQKVKEEVMNILKLIPGSFIIKQYEELLKHSVVLKKEKAILGMMTKVSIQQKLPAVVDDSIFKSGIEKLAGPKSTFTDEQFILYQLIAAVPPSFWKKQFDATPQQVVGHFEKYAETMVGALGTAVSRFGASEWVPFFLDQENKFYSDFPEMLPVNERDKYLLRFFKTDAKLVIHNALQCTQEWGAELAFAAISEMANQPYEYNRSVFGRRIDLIPVSILSQLEKIAPKDASHEQAWDKNRSHLIKLIGLKQQTLNAFNA